MNFFFELGCEIRPIVVEYSDKFGEYWGKNGEFKSTGL